MQKVLKEFRTDRGAAGKVFLIIFAIFALFAVVLFALWKPVILPLTGEAVPSRLSEDTSFGVPESQSSVTFEIPKNWVVQRGLFNPNTAQIFSPDLSLQITIETWPGGSAPSFVRGLDERVAAFEGVEAAEEPKSEAISPDVLVHYQILDQAESQILVALLGANADADTSKKASAIMLVTTHEGELQEYLPTLAKILKETQVSR